MIRFPCERYIWYLVLTGDPNTLIYRKLTRLGYWKKCFCDEHPLFPEIQETLTSLRETVCSIRSHTGALPDDVLLDLGLFSLWSNPRLQWDLQYLIHHSGARELADVLLCGGSDPKDVSEQLFLGRRLTISPDLLALYQAIVLDLHSLTLEERGQFCSLHSDGARLSSAIQYGPREARLLAGLFPAFEASEDLMWCCGASMVRLQEALRSGDSPEAGRWSGILRGLYELLGPALSFQKLLQILRATKIAAAPLDSARIQPGMDLSGRTSPKVLYAEVQDVHAVVLRNFNEEQRPAVRALLEAAKLPIRGPE